jgi:deoxyribodipyrimidine photolyase
MSDNMSTTVYLSSTGSSQGYAFLWWEGALWHVDRSQTPINAQEKEGRKMLDSFLTKKLKDYNSKRNTPVEDGQVGRTH